MTDTRAVKAVNIIDPNFFVDATVVPVLATRKITEDEVTPRLAGLALQWLSEEVTVVGTDNAFLNSVHNKWQLTGKISNAQIKGVANFATAKLRPNKWVNKKGEATKVANVPVYDLRKFSTGTYLHPSGFKLRITVSKKDGTYWASNDDKAFAGTRSDGTSFYTKYGASDQKCQQVIGEIAKDPTKALTAYGIATGKCGLCGRPLKDPASIKLAIGPTCLAGYIGKLGAAHLRKNYYLFGPDDVSSSRKGYVQQLSKYSQPAAPVVDSSPTLVNGPFGQDVWAKQERRRKAKDRLDEMLDKRRIRKAVDKMNRNKQAELDAMRMVRDESGRLVIKPALRVASTPSLSRNAKEKNNA